MNEAAVWPLQLAVALAANAVLCACATHEAPAEPRTTMLLPVGTTVLHKPLHTWQDLQRRHVAMQQHDYSCGAAALATLIKYYFGDEVSEAQILVTILASLSQDEVRDRERLGLSLLDLKKCAERLGYQAAGVKLNYANLAKLVGPALIHIERDDYKHFAIFRGIHGDRVFLADPSRGEIRMPVEKFSHEWTGVALVLGKRGFGTPTQYPLALAESDIAVDESLAARRALYSR